MKRQTLVSVIIALTVFGFLDAVYLAETALTGGQLACDIDGLTGCNAVAQSVYSQLFGIPLGVYGLVFYGLFFILTVATFVRPSQKIDYLLLGLAGAGALCSLYFLYAQFFLIKALCIYCVGSAVIAGLLLLASWFLVRGTRGLRSPETPSLPHTA